MKGMYATLVKRELWEYRWLWIAPLVAAGALIILTAIGAAVVSSRGMPSIPAEVRGGLAGMQNGLHNLESQLFIVAVIGMVAYLLDSLYAERKDRSILFWKSLPVSDFQTVTTKFCTGLVLLQLGTFVLASITYPIVYAIGAAIWPGILGLTGGWDIAGWLRAELWLLGGTVATILWYAPLAAWFMLVSVTASRSPYLLVGLPLVVLGVGEQILLRSIHVWQFARWRLLPVESFTDGIQRPGLWIGLAVAAGMLYIVIRVRRYRDDT